jgi:hypothetical protein
MGRREARNEKVIVGIRNCLSVFVGEVLINCVIVYPYYWLHTSLSNNIAV